MKRASWIGLAVLALLAAVPYVPAIHNPLIYDDRTLLDNRWLVHDAGPVSVFQHDYWYGTRHESSDAYRPLTVLSLAWNLRLAPSKESIRAVDVGMHLLATLVVAWMLASMMSRRGAWIGAALFAVHPLGSEAVLWAVGRAEIAAAILGMVAFVLFLKLSEERGVGGGRLALSVAAFVGALCFKESAAAWLAIGAVWLALRPKGAVAPAATVMARSACYAAAFAAYYTMRSAVVGWGSHAPPFVDNPLVSAGTATRAVNAVLLFSRYVGKMAWPRTLSVEYGFDQIPVLPPLPWAGAAAVAVTAVVVAATLALRIRGHRTAAFLVVFVPAAFAVTGNLVFPIGTIFGERLAYTPLIGFCGLAGLTISAIPLRVPRALAVGGLIVLGAARCVARGQDFRDVATLSEATAATSPRSVKSLFNAARTRLRQGRPEAAIPLLEKAIAIWPEYARAKDLLDQARAGAVESSGPADEGR